jgi:hypothetical protein
MIRFLVLEEDIIAFGVALWDDVTDDDG